MTIRPLLRSDASALLYQVSRNREFLTPRRSTRDAEYYCSYDAQLASIDTALAEQDSGRRLALAIVDETDQLVGQVDLDPIRRGADQSASLSYWVSAWHSGQGLASAAVRRVVGLAFSELRLHRLQAEILLDDEASEIVLRRNGFREFGRAPGFRNIAGRWQDHRLFQRLADA